MNSIQQSQQLGQAVWFDYIRRGMLKSGELQQLIDRGISGLTSNPTIFEKAIVGNSDYDEALLPLARSDKTIEEIFESLAIEDIRAAVDFLRPIYDESKGIHGYASLEVNPLLAADTEGTIKEARRLFATLDRPNVMIKVPATPEGIPAISQLISEGININVTLIFSLDSYQQVREAYITGLEDLVRNGGDPGRVASVASFFVSRVDTAVDAQLEELIQQGITLKSLLGKAAVANAKLAYQAFKETFQSERFAALKAKGARVQRPLWASTGTKNPAYSDLLYVEPLIGPDTVNTMPPATIDAFLEHGHAENTLEKGISEAEETFEALKAAGINMETITTKLLTDGVKAFADSFEQLLAGIDEKKARLLAPEHVHPGVSLGTYIADVEASLADLSRRDAVSRLWHKDHTLWKPDPREITNRLGWLNSINLMSEQVSNLQAFAQEVRDAGFRHVVLLGMGGSSLGPEVLRQTFGSAPGYPELMVLDSTVPEWVQAVIRTIDPAHTLFIVSSKSGGTTEPLSLYQYFNSLVTAATGRERAGQNFIAVTDPGTSLAKLAEENGFRRVFLNATDIGGRYSVLSYFGMVPAALIGIDIKIFLERANEMRKACAANKSAHENAGSWLGATIGTLALKSRDKLTLITSPAINSYGLWVEQLIAESIGKEGKGIIPVMGEPLVDPGHYSDDRLFVCLRLKGDDNAAIDTAMESIASSGQPVLTLEMNDKYDMGAEFFRWEFATAITGAILGIHAFDQPNVQAAKDATERLLEEYTTSGKLPPAETDGTLSELLARAGKGNYLAIMAYLKPMPEIDAAIADFRQKVVERYGIATTFGYGPRYLHSTGQLHKGGPDTGLFLQITADHEENLPVPGKPYTFGVVADAQALGDIQALQSIGRQVVKIHLPRGDGAAISELANQLA
ncbi:bifunctional transaldolase/phosoglucose isomerase [Bacteroidota bacterium]